MYFITPFFIKHLLPLLLSHQTRFAKLQSSNYYLFSGHIIGLQRLCHKKNMAFYHMRCCFRPKQWSANRMQTIFVKSYDFQNCIFLKGQSNQIFDHQFFSSFEPAWATDQCVKIVWFLVSLSPRYSYFSGVPPSMILHGVKFRAV